VYYLLGGNKKQFENRYKALNEAAYYCSGLVVSVLIFCIHVFVMGGTLSSRNVFTTITLVNISQFTMTKLVPTAIMTVSESYTSSQRIQKFLELPELQVSKFTPPHVNRYGEEDDGGSSLSSQRSDCFIGYDFKKDLTNDVVLLTLSDATFAWNTTTSTTSSTTTGLSFMEAVSNISLEFRSGQLYCVIGKVGCGKSALLQALAGELSLQAGRSTRAKYTSVAYAPQDPWIMNGTAQENILLGLDWDEDWYTRVIQSCGLEPDFTQWQHGDNTILGDRGVQCSGGQRSRIGLARALYRDPQVLLLDDPMSAVDTKVGRLIYQSAIEALAVQRGKCVILATHQHQFVVGTKTRCILLENGRICATGTYAECMETDASTSQLENFSSKEVPRNDTDDTRMTGDETDESSEVEKPSRGKDNDNAITTSEQNEQKEIRTTGIVKPNTWWAYAKAMGGINVAVALLLCFSCTQAASLVSLVQISLWAEELPEDQNSYRWLIIIGGLAAGTVVLSIARALLSFYFCTKASQRLHDDMTQSVLFARISFFDTNPSGRILNRFSADVGIADEQLPLTIYDFLVGCFMALGGVATAIAVLPMILVTIPPCVLYFWRLRQIFVATTRELKRLEGLARSPIFEMMTESLHGITSIRGNGAIGYFKKKFEAAHDAHSRAYFAFVASSRWFATRMEFITFFLMAAATALAVLCRSQGTSASVFDCRSKRHQKVYFCRPSMFDSVGS
jgi:ATP-binding cassette, subfamily C (CFTR/MRP), member 4